MKKRYYLIEPLDIDGDKNPDGFLVSQYRIDKNGNKIFLKNKYVTYKLLKERIKSKKGGGKAKIIQLQQQPQQQKIVYVDVNGNIINPNSQQRVVYVNENGYNMGMNQQYQYNQQPPQVIVRDNNSFGSNLTSGLGLGIGFAVGDNIIDGIFSMF